MNFKKQLQYLENNQNQTPRLPLQASYNHLSQHYYALGLHPFSIHQSLLTAARSEGKGKWSAYQQSLYIQFLTQNIEQMSSIINRKTYKVFLKMSRIIRTRTADQCRSHHQKILKYHQSVEDIITRYHRRIRGLDRNKKKEEWTRVQQNIQGFYTLKRIGNTFSLTIQQSAVEGFTLGFYILFYQFFFCLETSISSPY